MCDVLGIPTRVNIPSVIQAEINKRLAANKKGTLMNCCTNGTLFWNRNGSNNSISGCMQHVNIPKNSMAVAALEVLKKNGIMVALPKMSKPLRIAW